MLVELATVTTFSSKVPYALSIQRHAFAGITNLKSRLYSPEGLAQRTQCLSLGCWEIFTMFPLQLTFTGLTGIKAENP